MNKSPKTTKLAEEVEYTTQYTARLLAAKGTKLLDAIMIEERVQLTYKLRKDNTRKLHSKKVVGSTEKPTTFPLHEVDLKELRKVRESGSPFFLMKDSGRYYVTTEIPKNLVYNSSDIMMLHHMCSHGGSNVCARLTAASDKDGGCAKVRDSGKSKRIEKYPWIEKGFEICNTKNDAFIVCDCKHYKNCPPRKKYTAEEIKHLKLGLAQFMWDDVETLGQVRARKARNREINPNLY